ncbi:MAG: ATP-grasp domain-containing protein, partial [Chloroflexota bacterium]
YPDSALPGDEQRLIAKFGFPLVVKPRRGARSVGVSVVSNRRELAVALENGQNVIIQEHVGTPHEEYTAGVLCFDGHCQASIVMRRDLRDGNTYRAYVEPYPELNRIVRLLAEQLKPYGPANFQFRIDAEGRIKVFEINARFSGTTPLRAQAGFNEVEFALRYILLHEPVPQPEITPMIILRHWQETIIRQSDVDRIRALP